MAAPAALRDRLLDHGMEVGKCVGTGAFSEVWRCDKDGAGPAVVAAKVFTGKFTNLTDSQLVDVARKEYNALSVLQHSNVIALHSLIVEAGLIAIVEDFAPLGDLLSNVKPNVGLASDQGAAMMHGLCTGLAYLHNVHHLAHLDLKCENILVSPSFSAKIADFDAAMRIGSTMRQVRGTADVHPPEYLAAAGPRAEHTITASADMWAVGLIAHVVLFGRYLWDRADSNDAKYLAYRESPLATLPPNTPPGLARFFADCFAVDECARVSAADAVDRLAHDWLDWALVWHAPPRPAAPKRKTSRPLVRKLGQLFSSSRRRGRTDRGRT